MFTKNFNITVFLTSLILLIEGVSFIFCIPIALYFHETIVPFLLPSLITISFGLFFYIFSRENNKRINDKYQLIILVTYSWILLILLGTLPFLISKSISSPVNILFETISGFSTTGTTIVANIETLPKSILIWRSMTHWIGGIGVIIMSFTIFQTLDFGGYKILCPNLSSKDKNHINTNRIIHSIVLVYIILTFIQIILLSIGGMNLFESFCYAFGTVSTGSFYPNNSGLASYSSFIQYIITIFMLLSGIGYAFYFVILLKGFKKALKIEETRLFILIILIVTILISGILYFKSIQNIEVTFRESFFQVTSFVTNSGYSITNYLVWPSHVLVILVFFLFIGGCTNSATGGIKMSRFLILIRNLKMNFKMLNPNNTDYKIRYNYKNLDENQNLSILTFITVFGVIFMLGTMSLSSLGINFKESAFLSISSLSNFGYCHNLANFPKSGKIILIFLMLIGRLEIYTLILLFTPRLKKRLKQ